MTQNLFSLLTSLLKTVVLLMLSSLLHYLSHLTFGCLPLITHRKVPEYDVKQDPISKEFYALIDLAPIDGGLGIVGRGCSNKKKDAEKLAALDACIKVKPVIQRCQHASIGTTSADSNPKGQ